MVRKNIFKFTGKINLLFSCLDLIFLIEKEYTLKELSSETPSLLHGLSQRCGKRWNLVLVVVFDNMNKVPRSSDPHPSLGVQRYYCKPCSGLSTGEINS